MEGTKYLPRKWFTDFVEVEKLELGLLTQLGAEEEMRTCQNRREGHVQSAEKPDGLAEDMEEAGCNILSGA